MAQQAPTPLRLAFYGDDFTGSTDALEVLTFAGLRCALFLEPPSPDMLRQFGPFDAIGVAGSSRAMTPQEMDEQLPPTLAALAQLPVPLVHYKVCSTFDSSPAMGSIGHVMDLARQAFGPGPIPVVAATPALARYCTFGHLFARSGTDGQVYRLDRHPIMRHHPVTPMAESDLALHLGAQTRQSVAGFRLPQFELERPAQDAAVDAIAASGADALLFDGTTPAHLTETGRQLERLAQGRDRPLFAVGSSGLEYALTQWWRQQSASVQAAPGTAGAHDAWAHFDGVPQVLAVSASASALTAQQIDAAVQAGFAELPVDARALVGTADGPGVLEALVQQTLEALRAGRNVILHTARGNQDPRIEALVDAFKDSGMPAQQARLHAGRLLGQRLGELTERVLREVPLQRLLLSGGDTSSAIMQQLAPQGLQVVARLAPGAPLCRLLSTQAHLRTLQVALKGGQMGQSDFFVKAWQGTA